MGKYLVSAIVSLKEDTVYPISVLIWRLRNVLRLLVIYALWLGIIGVDQRFLGYSSTAVLSYILLTLMVQALVFSSRTIDVTEMISSGDLSNFLLRPINFFRYFFVLDLSNKVLNLFFSFFEFFLFVLFFKPPFYLQMDLVRIISFVILLILALLIYFYINLILGFIAFFAPENTWAPRFLFFMIVGFLAGELFPLDLLPTNLFKALMLTPFPYLIYFPIAVYLGRFALGTIVSYFLVMVFWLVFLYHSSLYLWQRGLKSNEAWGK